jgi:hypothetical protein
VQKQQSGLELYPDANRENLKSSGSVLKKVQCTHSVYIFFVSLKHFNFVGISFQNIVIIEGTLYAKIVITWFLYFYCGLPSYVRMYLLLSTNLITVTLRLFYSTPFLNVY